MAGNHTPHAPSSFIDNRQNIYIPIPLPCGVTIQVRLSSVWCQPSLLVTVLTTLREDVNNCLNILPPSVHPLICRTRIWVNGGDNDYQMGDRNRPQTLRHMTTHHYAGWLDWYVTIELDLIYNNKATTGPVRQSVFSHIVFTLSSTQKGQRSPRQGVGD
jgi:hypothetical protein